MTLFGIGGGLSPRPQRSETGYVYFIAETPDDEHGGVPNFQLTKVGWAKDPEGRRAELQCGNSRQLVLLGWVEGSRYEEREAHRFLAPHRVRGEWFRLPHAASIWLGACDTLDDTLDAVVFGLKPLAEYLAETEAWEMWIEREYPHLKAAA